jgi:hypothetical protein
LYQKKIDGDSGLAVASIQLWDRERRLGREKEEVDKINDFLRTQEMSTQKSIREEKSPWTMEDRDRDRLEQGLDETDLDQTTSISLLTKPLHSTQMG